MSLHRHSCRIVAGCAWVLLQISSLMASQTPRQEKAEFFRLLDLNNLSLTNWNKPLLAVGAQLTNAAALPSDEQALSVYASALTNLLANRAHQLPAAIGLAGMGHDGIAALLVSTNYNQTSMNWSQGDFDGNGTVNGADLNIVLSNYNQHLGVGAAVPEPSTLLLAAAGLAGLLCYAWRKRR